MTTKEATEYVTKRIENLILQPSHVLNRFYWAGTRCRAIYCDTLIGARPLLFTINV